MDLQEGMESLRIEMPATPKETSLPEAKTVEKPEPIIRIEDVDFTTATSVLSNPSTSRSRKKSHGLHRPLGVRQNHLASLSQSHERPDPEHACHREHQARRQEYLRSLNRTSSNSVGASA